MNQQLEYCQFAVGNTPLCVWGYNLHEANRSFLRGIDHKYFEYLVRTHAKELEGEDKSRALIALRSGYYHGLETFFSLLFSGFQAPGCSIAWLLKAQPRQVREMVKSIGTPNCDFPLNLSPDECTWEGISSHVNGILFQNRPDSDQHKKRFAELWRRFAKNYTDGLLDKEYNSFKHGFRMNLGSLRLSFAPSDDPTTPPADETFTPLCESNLGSFFFTAEQISGSPIDNPNNDPHFWLKEHHLNNHPTRPDLALMLVSLSINNLRAFLRIINGDDEKTGMKIFYPLTEDQLTAAWDNPPSLSHFATIQKVTEQQIGRMSRKEILTQLRRKQIERHINFLLRHTDLEQAPSKVPMSDWLKKQTDEVTAQKLYDELLVKRRLQAIKNEPRQIKTPESRSSPTKAC